MLILKYFTKSELLQLNTANIFSVLFYNSEIWHSPTLKTELKKKLNSISAAAIKTCMFYPDRMLSFRNTHKINNRAMPDSVMTYKMALQILLTKTYIQYPNLMFYKSICTLTFLY